MFNNKLLIHLVIVGLFFLGIKPAIAQLSIDTSVKTNRLLSQVRFKPPPGQGKPKRTSGAGTRNEWQCPQDAISTATSNILLDKPSAMALVLWTDFLKSVGLREIVKNLLKARFGELDSQLAAIIPSILKLPSTEYANLLLQFSSLSREELLARFE